MHRKNKISFTTITWSARSSQTVVINERVMINKTDFLNINIIMHVRVTNGFVKIRKTMRSKWDEKKKSIRTDEQLCSVIRGHRYVISCTYKILRTDQTWRRTRTQMTRNFIVHSSHQIQIVCSYSLLRVTIFFCFLSSSHSILLCIIPCLLPNRFEYMFVVYFFFSFVHFENTYITLRFVCSDMESHWTFRIWLMMIFFLLHFTRSNDAVFYSLHLVLIVFCA